MEELKRTFLEDVIGPDVEGRFKLMTFLDYYDSFIFYENSLFEVKEVCFDEFYLFKNIYGISTMFSSFKIGCVISDLYSLS